MIGVDFYQHAAQLARFLHVLERLVRKLGEVFHLVGGELPGLRVHVELAAEFREQGFTDAANRLVHSTDVLDIGVIAHRIVHCVRIVEIRIGKAVVSHEKQVTRDVEVLNDRRVEVAQQRSVAERRQVDTRQYRL